MSFTRVIFLLPPVATDQEEDLGTPAGRLDPGSFVYLGGEFLESELEVLLAGPVQFILRKMKSSAMHFL